MKVRQALLALCCALGCSLPEAKPTPGGQPASATSSGAAGPAAPAEAASSTPAVPASASSATSTAATAAPATPAPAAPPAAPAPLVERVFQKQSGGKAFTITLRATSRVNPELIELLEHQLRVVPVASGHPPEELVFWHSRPLLPDPERAEVQLEMKAANSSVDAHDFVFTWPEVFRISRPGVLEVRAGYEKHRPQHTPANIVSKPLEVDPDVLRGRVLCAGVPVPFLQVVAAGHGSRTLLDGTFTINASFPTAPTTLFFAYETNLPLAGTSTTAHLQIFDDFHVTRSDSVSSLSPSVTGTTANYGDVTLPGTDCWLWLRGQTALNDYFSRLHALPPAGDLRMKRWSAVFQSAGAGMHTFYDYIVIPTDFAATGDMRGIFHEFGHTIRHVADGDMNHWNWDDVRFIYARSHDGTEIADKGYSFNEGWANYWGSVLSGGPFGVSTPTTAFLDWNEDRIMERLWAIATSAGVGHTAMVRTLLTNRGTIHTLFQFEQRLCASLPGVTNAFCSHGAPTRPPPPSCPPGFNDDGATCRLINIISKPSFGRGAGTVPSQCPPGKEYDAGLCYPLCPSGMHGVGPVCWQICPSGFHDDGATCRRDAQIIGADNRACPWYDKCGLTFARGCSVCPAGFNNDGCTCRIDVNIIGKSSSGRGVGTIPSGCAAPLQEDAGLCYPACSAGFHGVGPVCWGSCPAGFADHGATCYRDPNVFSDDGT
ncbi:MAG: hypothetical protein JST92_02555 [Deltaproteobacteria bacterium]|nr:hypothetical protein [Deltaproteobacteria bacterium]